MWRCPSGFSLLDYTFQYRTKKEHNQADPAHRPPKERRKMDQIQSAKLFGGGEELAPMPHGGSLGNNFRKGGESSVGASVWS